MLSAAAQKSLESWHHMVAARDMRGLGAIVTPDVVFRSPFVWKPYVGKPEIIKIISTVMTVFEDFSYGRTFTNATGCVLEFAAHVGDRQLIGVDLIEFDEAGLIKDFMVMIRPGSGLEAVAREMGRKLATA